jgi:hypothetical protein
MSHASRMSRHFRILPYAYSEGGALSEACVSSRTSEGQLSQRGPRWRQEYAYSCLLATLIARCDSKCNLMEVNWR